MLVTRVEPADILLSQETTISTCRATAGSSTFVRVHEYHTLDDFDIAHGSEPNFNSSRNTYLIFRWGSYLPARPFGERPFCR